MLMDQIKSLLVPQGFAPAAPLPVNPYASASEGQQAVPNGQQSPAAKALQQVTGAGPQGDGKGANSQGAQTIMQIIKMFAGGMG